jgi:hypothetical protein
MNENSALTVSIGVLAVIDTYLTATALPIPVWVTFIAWASFFAVGGTPFGIVKSTACNFAGIAIASCTLLAIAFAPSQPIVTAILVGVGTAGMIVASLVKLISFPPAIVFGFASTVGTVAATGHPITMARIGNPALIAATAMLVGNGFGLASEFVANMLTAKAATPNLVVGNRAI